MANILSEEKRFPYVGEVCAIKLKNIIAVSLVLTSPGSPYNVILFPHQYLGISRDDDITFVKHLGNGLFMDLITDQLFITSVYSIDEIGAKAFDELDLESEYEILLMRNNWLNITQPDTMQKFNESFNIFTQNPLTIAFTPSTFMSINSEIIKTFASQSLEEIKTKILSAKSETQKSILEYYSKFEEIITEFYSTKVGTELKK